MFTAEQMKDAFNQAQNRASTRARAFEQEARKVLETLGDRAQAEVKRLLELARTGSREQLGAVGVELEKLGKKLQEIAAQTAKTAEKPAEAAPETQPRTETVQ
jgi:hypothetical protein